MNTLCQWISWFNQRLGQITVPLACVLLALMVVVILLQVVMRYVFNNTLPWPEEMARAMMIWMTALVAGPAFRSSHFVAITFIEDYLPTLIHTVLRILLAGLVVLVLLMLTELAVEFFQRGFRSRAASMNIPRAWIYLSMTICYGTMLIVGVELLLKECITLIKGEKPSC